MDENVYTFLRALMVITCNFIWLIFRHFRPSSLGYTSEKNSNIIETASPPDATTPKMSYAGTRQKQRTTPVLTET